MTDVAARWTEADAVARWTEADAARLLRKPSAGDDKYRRGVLGVRTGGSQYPGAAVLGVSAAWRAGAGMVRYVPPIEASSRPGAGADSGVSAYPGASAPPDSLSGASPRASDEPSIPPQNHAARGTAPSAAVPSPAGRGNLRLPSPAAAVLAAHPETVFGEPTGRPCDAWLIGSGTDPRERSAAETSALLACLTSGAPLVIDAGALDLARRGNGARGPAILTPHGGEFERVWRSAGLGALPEAWDRRGGDVEARGAVAVRLARELGAAVLLKGSVSIVAAPSGWVRRVGPATPWLATAGTGDVLAGVLGALVASHADAFGGGAGGAAVAAGASSGAAGGAASAGGADAFEGATGPGGAAGSDGATAFGADADLLDADLLGELGATAALLHDRAARIASGDSDAVGAGRPITASDVARAIPAAFAELAQLG